MSEASNPLIQTLMALQPMPQPQTESAPIQGQLQEPNPAGGQSGIVQFEGPSAQTAQTVQKMAQPPKATAGYGLPGVISLIGQFLKPHSDNPLIRPPTRLDAFEQFLGQFTSSLGAGLAASGTGPGANIRGAAAAINAPHQRLLQDYQLQQQQQEQQARIGQQQAQTQFQTAETAAIPQRLEFEHQQAVATLGLRTEEMKLNAAYREAALALQTNKFDLSKQKQVFDQANKTWEQGLRERMFQAQQGNIQSQIQFRAASMQERRYMDSQVTELRQQANQLRAQGNEQHAQALELQADNITNRIGIMATVESELGLRKVVTPQMPKIPPVPGNQKPAAGPPTGNKGKVLVEGKDF